MAARPGIGSHENQPPSPPPNRTKGHPVTGRVLSRLLFAFGLALLAGAALIELSAHRLEGVLQRRAEVSLAQKAHLAVLQIPPSESGSLAIAVRRVAQETGAATSVFGADGRLLSASPLPPQESSTANSGIPGEVAAALAHPEATAVEERNGYVYVAVAADSGGPGGREALRMAEPLSVIAAPVRAFSRDLLASLVVSMLIGAVLAAIMAWRSARRLNRIVVFAQRVANGDLSARVEEADLDEYSAVARALDTTASRLEQSFQALESSRSELTALLNSMQEAVIAVDAAGRVSWCNAVLRKIALTPIQEGRALVNSVRDPEVLTAVSTALQQGSDGRARSTSLAPGRVFEVNAAPMPGGGAVAVLHDISEIERSEASRRDFIANVSHELRTPLTCVMGYVETLLDSGEIIGQAREFLQIILKNAGRMSRLTEDLLALAGVESGDYKVQLRPIPASRIVEDAVTSLAGLVLDSNLILEIGEKTDQPVMADPDALDQVFGNLVENAIKYGKTGMRIRAGARCLESCVEFYVQDFGSGIAFEHLDRIFERFYRVDKARSRESGGTGLGLAIAKQVVHLHGGDIRCESELGSGATFLFRLPRCLPPSQPATDGERPTAPAKAEEERSEGALASRPADR